MDSTHNAYAVGYSNHSLLLLNMQLFVVEDGNGRPGRKSADGAIPIWHSIACILNGSHYVQRSCENFF